MTPEQKAAMQRAAIARAKDASRRHPDGFYDYETGEFLTDEEAARPRTSRLGSVVSGMADGASLGAVDEVAGFLMGDEQRDKIRAQQAANAEDYPGANITGQLLGGLSTLALPGSGIARTGSKLRQAATAATAGGLVGGLYGFNSGEGGLEPRVENALQTGLVSAAIGGVTPSAARGIERFINSRIARKAVNEAVKNAPTNDDLAAAASRIYDAADNVPLPRAGLASVAQTAQDRISRRPINSKLMPKTAGVMDELTDVATAPGANVPFGELDEVRQLTRVPRADFANPAEQRGGKIIADSIDEFVDAVDPALGKEIGEARKMWSTLRKNDMIEEAIAKADLQASGFENGLRVQFRSILNNKKKSASLSQAEKDAMREIVEGTRIGNAMKKLGKLGFGRGQQSNVMSGTVGTAVFGPASLIAGQTGAKLSESITGQNAARLAALVRSGGLPNPITLAKTAPELPGLIQRGLASMGNRVAEPLAGYINR